MSEQTPAEQGIIQKPLPTPREGEEQSAFVSRCVSAVSKEFKDNKQAVAVCYSQWRQSKKTDEFSVEAEKLGGTRKSGNAFILKSDKRFIVGGYANVYMLDKDGKSVPDKQNEVVTLKALDEALQLMMAKESRRNHMYWHTNMQIGEIMWETTDSDGVTWKSHVVYEPNEQYPKRGLFILSELFTDNPLSVEAMNQMKGGGLLEFSIGGLPLVTEHKCDTDKCWTEITKLYLGETSSCENAINVESKAFILKAEEGDETQRIIKDMEKRIEALEKTLTLKDIANRLSEVEKAVKTPEG